LTLSYERHALKYLIVIVVVALGIWLWRRDRDAAASKADASPAPKPQAPATSAPPQIMLSCAVCGVHLPKSDALVGKQGNYCSAAHRQQAEA
jgi:uncharacterized protein